MHANTLDALSAQLDKSTRLLARAEVKHAAVWQEFYRLGEVLKAKIEATSNAISKLCELEKHRASRPIYFFFHRKKRAAFDKHDIPRLMREKERLYEEVCAVRKQHSEAENAENSARKEMSHLKRQTNLIQAQLNAELKRIEEAKHRAEAERNEREELLNVTPEQIKNEVRFARLSLDAHMENCRIDAQKMYDIWLTTIPGYRDYEGAERARKNWLAKCENSIAKYRAELEDWQRKEKLYHFIRKGL
jgi:hypothetical protein